MLAPEHGREESSEHAAPPRGAGPIAEQSPILALQRAVGNRATAALVARREAGLAVGAKGFDVLKLQAELNAVDKVAKALIVDGDFGSGTQTAVKQYQAATGVRQTGVATGALQVQLAIDASLPQDPETIARKCFDLGAQMYSKGRHQHAADYFLRAQELAPQKPAAAFAAGQALRKAGGHRQQAIEMFQLYIDLGGTTRAAEAQEHIDELSAHVSGNKAEDDAAARAAFEKASGLYAAGDYTHALDQFEIAREYGDRASITFAMAQTLKKVGGRRDEAIAEYAKYMAVPGATRALEAAGQIADLKAVHSGIEPLDEAVGRGAFDKGNALYSGGQYGQAADQFEKAQDALPDKPAAAFAAAQALRKAGGHAREAIAMYERYLQLGGTSRAKEASAYIEALRTTGAAF